MSLSRKHFEAIADGIKDLVSSRKELDYSDEPFINLIDDMCYMCRQDNPNFNRDKFIEACGFPDGLYPDED